MPRRREEVLNVVLAQCICDSGMAADPENILRTGLERDLPDVIVSIRGLRCVIEGKTGDVSGAREEVAADADGRLASGIAHIAIAVIYPVALRSASFEHLGRELRDSRIEFSVRTEAGATDWRVGSVEELLAELRRAHERLVEEDVLVESVERLEIGMQPFVNIVVGSPAASRRLAKVLGVHQESGGARPTDDDD